MAVLGAGGRLRLKRPFYDGTTTLPDSSIDIGCDRLNPAPEWLWNGDQISAIHLPIYCEPSGLPYRVSGYGSYRGSKWFLGPNRDHIDNNDDDFYKKAPEGYPDDKEGDEAFFYCKPGRGDVPEEDCGTGDFWVHLDPFGNISFYTNRCSALKGCKSDRIELAPIAGDIIIGPVEAFDYRNGQWGCDGATPCQDVRNDYSFSDVQDEDTDISLCQSAPGFQFPVAGFEQYGNADVQDRGQGGFPGWQVMCEMREWTLELDAPNVDVTAVSEKWGEQVKSIVSGGGTLEFFIDRKCYDAEHDAALVPMQLLMMTNNGCEAEAEFWMMTYPIDCGPSCGGSFGGGLYYSAKILITATAVNLRPKEILAGTASFVTTEEIRLIQAP
jgi:hypothetical protein